MDSNICDCDDNCDECFCPDCPNSWGHLKRRYNVDMDELYAMKMCETTTLASWNQKIDVMSKKYKRFHFREPHLPHTPKHILANK